MNKPRIVKLVHVETLSPKVKLFLFKDELCSKASPGQFIMVWIPGVDEIPISLSVIEPEQSGIIVAKVGEATSALHEKEEGDLIGIRGPYGNNFKPIKGKALVIGGGVGIAPLLPLSNLLVQQGSNVTLVFAAKSKDEIFLERIYEVLSKGKLELIIATEDGSLGRRGTAVDIVDELLKEERFDMIYVCGKELMMKGVFDKAEEREIPIQASLSRYMKCGLGICGHCVIDPLGLRVCKDGPVFDSNILRKVSDFGNFERTSSGRKVSLYESY